MALSTTPGAGPAAPTRLTYTPPAAFAETAASMRRAFDELRAAEHELERQLSDLRAQIDSCARVTGRRAAKGS